jgi:hypothetical protein
LPWWTCSKFHRERRTSCRCRSPSNCCRGTGSLDPCTPWWSSWSSSTADRCRRRLCTYRRSKNCRTGIGCPDPYTCCPNNMGRQPCRRRHRLLCCSRGCWCSSGHSLRSQYWSGRCWSGSKARQRFRRCSVPTYRSRSCRSSYYCWCRLSRRPDNCR